MKFFMKLPHKIETKNSFASYYHNYIFRKFEAKFQLVNEILRSKNNVAADGNIEKTFHPDIDNTTITVFAFNALQYL